MAGSAQKTLERWRDWAMLVLAAWLFVSPWVLGYAATTAAAGAGMAAWNAWIVGVIVAALAVATLVRFAEWEDWVSLVFGVWLIAAPWVLGFSALAAATWNQVIVGLLIAVLAAWEIWAVRHAPTRAAA